MPLRKIPILLTFLTLTLLLAACQGGTDSPQRTAQPTASDRTPRPVIVLPSGTPAPSPTPTPDHPVVPAESLHGRTVTFWHPWQGELDTRARALVDAFNRTNHEDIEVTMRSLYSDGALEEALDAAAAAGPESLPDVIAGTSAQLAVLGDAGALENLNPYLNHPESGFSEAEIADHLPAYWGQDVLAAPTGDMRVGVPLLRTAHVLFYNQTWAQELGYTTPPVTTADFKAQTCAASVVNNQSRMLDKFGTGGWMIDSDPLTGLSWFNAYGAQLPQPGEPFTFESEEAGEAVAYLQDLGANACIWTRRSGTPQEELARRRALFVTGTLQDMPQQKAVMGLHKNEDQWTVIAFPGEEGAGNVFAYGYSLALVRHEETTSEQQMAAWLFLRWLSQPEQAAQLAEAWPSLPVSTSVEEKLSENRSIFPWNTLLPLEDRVLPAPSGPQWPLASRVLEDVTWSIFHLPKEQTVDLLSQADETLREMQDRPAAEP